MPKAPKQQVVYIMLYGHKYGTDCSAYSTEGKAQASIGGIINQYIDDVPGEKDRKRIKKLLKDGHIMKASNIWVDIMEEWFEISPRTVDT